MTDTEPRQPSITRTPPEQPLPYRTGCPDGGVCHHFCDPDPKTEPCFRTLWCAPFSAYNNGQWKEDDQ